MQIRGLVILFAVGALIPAACSSSGDSDGVTPTATAASGPRPSSPAALKILEPKNGAVVRASGTTMKVSLLNATLVPATSLDITPTDGHLHVLVDDQLISMTEGLEQTLPDLAPGTHVLRVEFVASDHVPFEPRVVTQAVFVVDR